MDDASKEAIFSAIRSLLIVAGSSLAAHGYIQSGQVNEIVGAVMVILPVAWGIWQKFDAEHKTQARVVAAVQNPGVNQ